MRSKKDSNLLFYLISIDFFCLTIYSFLGKSEPGNVYLFGYSFQRLVLILTVLTPTILLTCGIILSIKNKDVFKKINNRMREVILSPIVLLIIEISILFFGLVLCNLFCIKLFYQQETKLFLDRLPQLYKKIQPYIYTYFLICFQIKIFQKLYHEKNRYTVLIKKISLASPYFIVIVFFLSSTFFSNTLYTKPNYSIATNDTDAYIRASEVDFLTIDFFTSNRPATISLFYKLLSTDAGYNLTTVAQTSENSINKVEFQPSFHRISLGQTLISSLSWFILTLTIVKILTNPLIKILGGILVTLFSVTPQITDWNNVLQSESLSISLFALFFSVAILWATNVLKTSNLKNNKNISLSIFFFISLTLWVFTRDSNSYFLLGFAGIILILLLVPSFRRKLPLRLVISTLIFVSLLFLFHSSTFKRSDRWVNPIMNNLKVYILPDEKQLEIFKSFGMPVDNDVLALPRDLSEGSYREHKDLYKWLVSYGLSSYKKYLLLSPKHLISLPINNLDVVFSENIQPYYINRDAPKLIVTFGNYLHSKTPNIIFFEILLLLLLAFISFICSNKDTWAKFLVFSLFFLNSILMYIAIIHGDASSIVRHSLVSVLPVRLYFWLLLLTISDKLIQKFIKTVNTKLPVNYI